jgi:hypothetical protein
MREDLTDVNAVPDELHAEIGLRVTEWETLPASVRISFYIVDALTLLGMAKEELTAQQALPLLPIEPDLERAIELTGGILKRLDT